ncbi:MAG TPA: ATP-grasp domain-containing protein [Caldilineaceae bacterium]|nr:ATP-grasp domain-containing protein [Caldilineaceae bacterium]
MASPLTVLCLASYFKGGLFLEECHRQGAHVVLVTEQKLADEEWPRNAIDEFFTMPDLAKQPDITYAVSYLARTRSLDCLVALDDYDVETAAALREHLRLPGLGSSAARLFRDKLAMRVRACEQGIPVPDFVHVLNYDRLRAFMERVPPPWVLKPRAEAGSMGIKKVHSAEEVWSLLETLGDRQSFYVLERFVPGDVYHVDSIVWDGQAVFAVAHRYGLPPMTVYQGGGVFVSSTLVYGSAEEVALQALNRAVIAALGMERGVTHAEYIRSEADGRFCFLEIAARVGGAGVDKLVEMATGINPWVEWARLELAFLRGASYAPPASRQEYAGLLVSLARQEWPDTTAYNEPEVVWRLHKRHHVGLIVAAPDPVRVQSLVAGYAPRIAADFTAIQPPLDRPPE